MVALSWQLRLCLLSPMQGRPPNLVGGLLHSLVRVDEPAHPSQSDQADQGLHDPWTAGRGHSQMMCLKVGVEKPSPTRELEMHARRPTWTEGDDRARLPLDLDADPTVRFLFSGAGRSAGFGLWAAAAAVAGH